MKSPPKRRRTLFPARAGTGPCDTGAKAVPVHRRFLVQRPKFWRNIFAVNGLSNPSSAAFRLNELDVHPTTGRIEGPGGAVHLEPRLMAVLQALARKPGELVSRGELLAEIWPGGEVYDEALTQCVYQLRQQLRSAGGDEAYRNLVTTVPKRGYVLNGEIHSVARDTAANEPRLSVGTRQRHIVIALAVSLLLLAAWTALQWGDEPASTLPMTQNRSVAVLPFLPLVAENREPVLELGMADTLITQLSGIRQLVVRPVTAVRRYGGLERDSLEAGRELGVNVVIDGSVQRSGETLRVTVRMLRVADGAALWAETFSAPFDDIFTVQDEICGHIAAALALELGQDERRQLASSATSSTEAYERYLRGRYHLARLTPQDLRESVEHFRAAVTLDPDYAQAWVALANVQFRIPIAGEVPPKTYYPDARRAAERALELDPDLAEAHAMLGWIAHWFEWDWEASEKHFQRAIEMNPNDTESHLGYAHLLSTTGRIEQALVEVRRARELSPNYPAAAALEGGFLVRAGRHDEALRRLEESREIGDDLWLFRITLAGVYAGLDRYEDALAESTRARELSGDSSYAMAVEVGILARMGRTTDAEILFNQILQRSSGRYVPPYDLALGYLGLGDTDNALHWLQQAYEARDPKTTLLPTGTWSNLGERQEYRELLQRMRLQPITG